MSTLRKVERLKEIMAQFVELTCPICHEDDFDATGLALHFLDCDKARGLRLEYAQKEAERRDEFLSARNSAPDRDSLECEARFREWNQPPDED